VVICSLYVLTPCFYYIPDAILSAVVIHAVADLVSSPRYLKQLSDTSPLDLLVWAIGVAVTICTGVQTGIYAAVGLSMVIMLFKMARPPVKLLARIPVPSDDSNSDEHQHLLDRKEQPSSSSPSPKHLPRYIYMDEQDLHYVEQHDPLPPGLLVFQLSESILYPNAEFVTEAIISSVKSRTKCNSTADLDVKAAHHLPWNQQPNTSDDMHRLQRPVLRALVLDLTSARRLDSTALHALVNLRNNVEKYAGVVEWHFVGIQSGRLRQDLIYHGFPLEHFNSPDDNDTGVGEKQENLQQQQQQSTAIVMHLNEDLEIGQVQRPSSATQGKTKLSPDVKECRMDYQRGYSCYHWDVNTAVNSIWKRWHALG
jgi:sodium-independent sulfate anion transporter 11